MPLHFPTTDTFPLDLQYWYHKEHKNVSYAMKLHSRFSITLMHHQIHDPWGEVLRRGILDSSIVCVM